jgi:hypothetical protein
MQCATGFFPWVATQEDREATDWTGVGESGDNGKMIFDREVVVLTGGDGEIYAAKSYVTIIQAPELIANVVNFRTWYLPELTPAQCDFSIFFTQSGK